MEIYVVQPGDTAYTIAAAFQVPIQEVIFANQLVPPYTLAIGQALLIPTLSAPGQNLSLSGPASSLPGPAPSLPGPASSLSGPVPSQPGPTVPTTPSRSPLVSFDYAYTFISPWVLEQTLPFLSDLHIFSYGFTPQGMIVPPIPDDTWMITAASAAGVRPILTLTPFGPDGQFSNALISSIVQNPAYKQTLIQQLLAVLERKGFGGVDVDFEYVLASDRDAFTAFVSDLADALHAYGYQITIALAPKTSADQAGLLYEGKDYAALGAVVDAALLMTYEWGYKFGPNMAVAPLNMVRRVVEYAVTEIPTEKINLGIPNYGYDWPLPYLRNTTVATTIGNVEAVQIAINNGATIRFDEESQSPYFNYLAQNQVWHEVWFEDVRSIDAKFNLIKEFGLRGAGYWQLMRWWRANWLLLRDRFEIVRR